MEGEQKEMAIFMQLKRNDNSHGPINHLALTPSTVTALSGLGSRAKNPALQAEAVQELGRVWQVFCLTALSSH